MVRSWERGVWGQDQTVEGRILRKRDEHCISKEVGKQTEG